jgi:hypothetical protein
MDTGVAPHAVQGLARGFDRVAARTRYLVPLGRAAFAAVFLWFAALMVATSIPRPRHSTG